jgi:hypothetical protein
MPKIAAAKVQTKIINETANGVSESGPCFWMNKTGLFIRLTK